MPQIALIATDTIRQFGLDHRKGDRFETTAIYAAALTRQRKATFATVADDEPRRKRAYRRRDMTAETVSESS
jgi:hypothetical protein